MELKSLTKAELTALYNGELVVEEMHRSVYADYFSPKHMERFVQLPLKPNEPILTAPEWMEEDDE